MLENFRTYQIAVDFYHNCHALTCKGNLRDQLHRAASSIAVNLAEGRGRETLKDQKRFFHIALGSVRECQAILTLIGERNSSAGASIEHLAASLYRLIKNAK